MSERFKPRILLLPLAAAIIAGLVWFKATRPRVEVSPSSIKAYRQWPATDFILHDQNSQKFKLSRFLGRHKILVVFFDPTGGAAGNRQLQILKEGYTRLTSNGQKVIAISSATPWANRESFKQGGQLPFPVLSDADNSVQTRWGIMTRDDPPRVIPSVFVINRASVVCWSQIGGSSPIPLDVLLTQLQQAR